MADSIVIVSAARTPIGGLLGDFASLAAWELGAVAIAAADYAEQEYRLTKAELAKAAEKIHEEMITTSDSFYTYDLGKYYTILPTVPNFKIKDFVDSFSAKKVTEGFNYDSGTNTEWETIESLRNLIKEHVDSNFE